MEYRGNPVSHGIAIGDVYLYTPFQAEITEKTIGTDEIEAAVQAYFDLRTKAQAELAMIQEKLQAGSPDKAKIFAAHVDMLLDAAVNGEIETLIRDAHLSPECAIERGYSKFIRLFSKAKVLQIRERAADLRDLKTRLHRIWAGVPERNLSALEKEVIIAAHDLLPSDTATLDRSKVLGIVTEIGGRTSHSAIIARSYEIPAILGVPNIMAALRDGERVILDAVEGVLYTSPDEAACAHYAEKRGAYLAHAAELKQYRSAVPVTRDGVPIEVHLNMGSADPDELSGSLYTDGVGLFRTEFMYLSSPSLPTEEEQFQAYRKVALEFGQRPVILRTLDIGGDKQLESMELPREDNPFLGLRALRLCFENLPLFQAQLRAVFRAACYGNLWLMLPMVGSLDDIRAAKAVIEEVKEALRQEGITHNPDIPVGIMIEIPAIALVAELAAEEVDFASIGTNDLCQYLMAVDRLNPAVANYYQSYHPAMFRLIGQTVSAFSAAGKSIGVCGELGGDPLAAAVLIGLGMRKLSMGISSVPGIKKLITGLTIPQAEALAKQVMSCATADEVEQCLRAELGTALPAV
ncbi:MAG: phosphoenolpyruvate--protein phosphotransferase [Oscillospiraceae bacterium]|nr:phosphoenolpyruvate--protein phosphotransferase [Oscillospiraceae bacterium]